MRIGRLEFGIAKGFPEWGAYAGSCGCKFLDLGRIYFIWLDKECKCSACKKYTCECKE
jgi:hypothetical protein